MATESKYQNGKIYKIITENSNDVYIGSTTQSLKERLRKHEVENRSIKKYCSSSVILNQGGYTIKLIKNYPCDTKKELELEEGKYQREIDCVNEVICGRTTKEYYIDKKGVINENCKTYYKKKREEIRKRHEKYNKDNKEEIRKQRKMKYEKNKEEIIKQRKIYIEKNKEKLEKRFDCPCGGKYQFKSKATHFKSKKHKKYLENL